jgi:uncharacterized protein (TIGR03437 family)
MMPISRPPKRPSYQLRSQFCLLLCALLGVLSSTRFTQALQTGCSGPSFAAGTSLNGGANPQALVAGDFNLDGRLDVAVANRGGKITLLFNDGNGSFTTTDFNVGGALTDLAAGDFNGDQRLDLVVASEAGVPLLYLNNGTGGFPTVAPVAAAGAAPVIAVGDFNADGKLDVAAGINRSADGTNTGVVSVTFGNGTGGFGAPATYTVGTRVLALLSGNLDGDGKTDLVVLNPANEGFATLLNDGSGAFAAPVSYTIGVDSPTDMAGGDFNSDGMLDLAIISSINNRVSVQLNSGNGVFLQAQNFAATASPISVATNDFNSDGKADLVIGTSNLEAEIRLGNDAAQFNAETRFALGGRASAILGADVNSDGRPDVVTANAESTVTLLRNTCSAPPLNTPPIITPGSPLTRQQGVAASTDVLATVSDVQTPNSNLQVFLLSASAGLNITNLTNSRGTISAMVGADCTAAPLPLTATLLVSDAGGLSAMANLTINVTANTPPTLGAYPNVSATAGAGTSVTPDAAPNDNTQVSSVTATASAGFTGTLNTNAASGAVTITNAAPLGTHTITVTARDNCNATATQSFTLTVNAPACVNTRPGLVSWYRGENSAADHQNTHNGAGVGELGFAAGRVGQALNFNGSSELVIPHAPALNFQQFTFEGWVFPTVLDGSVELILNKEDDPFTTYHYEWGIAGTAGNVPVGTLLFALNGIHGLPNEFNGFVNGGGIVPRNTWTHVALSFDGTTIKSYLNGRVARTLSGLSGNLITSTGPLKLGSRSATLINQLPADRFNGLLDELSLYSRALSEQELLAIYNAGTAGKCTTFVNTNPTFTAGAALTQQRGTSGTLAVLGTVSDTETAASELTVAVANAPEGLSFSKLTNMNGTITGTVAVACDVALGANAVTLRVSDGELTSTATFTVNVTANTPPVLGTYAAPAPLRAGESVEVIPTAAPTDSGALANVVALVAGAFSGSVSVNPTTGVVMLSNVRPAGTFTATITATDNCGATATTSFNFTVSKLSTTVSLTAQGAPFIQGQAIELSAAVTAATVLATPPSGMVTFFEGTTNLGMVALDSAGTARLRVTFTEAGARGLTAVYSGDNLFFGATSTPLGLNITYAVTHVSAASYRGATLAPEQIVAAFGTRLATTRATALSLPLPTVLGGTLVRFRDSAGVELLAPLFFVSPSQVNYVVPRGLAPGAGIITVIGSDGVNSVARVQLAATNPGIFTVDSSGRGLPAAQVLRVLANGVQRFEPVTRFDTASNKFVAVPIDLGTANEQVFLILFGTGWRGRNLEIPAGASLGSAIAEVVFLGAAPGQVGVDQANLRIPRSLAGAGEIEVNLSVDGKAANPVRIQIK